VDDDDASASADPNVIMLPYTNECVFLLIRFRELDLVQSR
jgi:hypothetical protein